MSKLAKCENVYDAARRFVRFGLIDQKFVEKDPFIFFDHFTLVSPTVFADHPHSGFESVTYVIKGELFHGDNYGNKNVLGPDSIQNMNSGEGIVHREMPVGIADGLNLWVNLPHDEKDQSGDFVVGRKTEIPKLEKDGATVRLLMGKSLGMTSKVMTRTPSYMMEVILKPGASHVQPINPEWTNFVYTMLGDILASGSLLKARHTADFAEGDHIKFVNRSKKKLARFYFFSGQPLGQSMYIHAKGSHAYVMATKEDALKAEAEFKQRGKRFGI